MVETQLDGFLPPDFAGPMPVVDVRSPAQRPHQAFPRTEIHNARVLQASARSEAEFLAQHGFVLLPHQTAVRDWASDSLEPRAPMRIP